jgi:hypothetical protein
MPLQNRVTPTGELIATPARGTFMGNRGCLHDAQKRIVRPSAVRRWIVCVKEWKGVRRPVMSPGLYTELFFLDEPTGLAAGHRPCAFCRRGRFNAFVAAWRAGNPHHLLPAGRVVDALDAVLHAERLDGRRKRTHPAELFDLPAGAMVLIDGKPHLVEAATVREWTPFGYGEARPKRRGPVELLTPPSVANAIAAGYTPDPFDPAAAG